MADKVIGIDLGGTSVKLAVVDSQRQVLDQWSIPTDVSDQGQHIVNDIVATIIDRLGQLNLSLDEIKAIGMGSPGTIDHDLGQVKGAYNLNWQDSQPVRQAIQEGLGRQLPVAIENDANVAAMGEQFLGAAKDCPDIIMVTLGTGVGGGVIVDGHLVVGMGAAGEVGHMFAQADGYQCTCGQTGCLETVASANGIARLAADLHKDWQGAPSSLAAAYQAGQKVTSYDLVLAAQAGDDFADYALETSLTYLAHSLGQMASVTHPQVILIGGGVANAGQYLLDKLVPLFKQAAYPAIAESTQIAIAQLGSEAGVIGAASLAFTLL
ncbi:glucokinase [Aerococcus urinaehominis]|uniref:Glucokinase n=1 Tax=Aerococcus urinaehominis TaxID=128944 RepID=A0A0X8FLN6_9LACT|nr:ROK family glucokinase [Aerococcus urinaehominis]AMB98917.1 glucokinase [Aerococcus urinaehominis]SDM39485.1 glucokinase [Aerococcus urinaehominis]